MKNSMAFTIYKEIFFFGRNLISGLNCYKVLPCVNFINVLRTAFALIDPKSVTNTVKSSVSFYAFGIYERKSCT